MTAAGYSKWTEDEAQIACETWQRETISRGGRIELAERNAVLQTIADELGFAFERVYNRHIRYGHSFGFINYKRLSMVERAKLEWNARLAAQERQSITGMVFGDPLPGFSALDRKRAQHA